MKSIIESLKKIWNFLKKIFVKILNFVINIFNWFKAKYQQIIKKRPNVKPIAIKIEKNLKDGNYNTVDFGLTNGVEACVVNTFYDEKTGEILTDDTEVIQAGSLDKETLDKFGDKEMLVLS